MSGSGTATPVSGLTRSTMANLITELRALTNAGTSDYTAGTTTYWTDTQLQDVLDARSGIIDFWSTNEVEQRSGSTYIYKIYDSGYSFWEGTPTVMSSDGTALSGTLFSFDWRRGRVTFTDDQAGSARMVSGTIYDINGAAADIWRKKADHYALAYDVSTDNHSLKRSQLYAQALQMASKYDLLSASASGAASITVERGDT